MNPRSGFLVLALALVPAAAAAINLSPSQPDAEPGTLEMGTMRAAWTDTSTLLFSVTPLGGGGGLTVQAYDPSGAPVPRSFRGVPAIGLIDYHPANVQSYQVASYGSGVMVVAVTTSNGISAARVQPSGVSLDRAPIVLRPEDSPSLVDTNDLGLACTPSTCLAVYGQYPDADPNTSVAAQRVGTDGRLLDAVPLALGWWARATPVVVALADRFIVAWTTELTGSPSNVVAARVMADGRVLDLGGRDLGAVGGARLNVRIATDGTRVFMSWYARAAGSTPAGWYTRLFDADLNPVSALAYHADLSAAPYQLDLWWDGTHYVQHGTSTVSGGPRQVVRFDATGTRVDTVPHRMAQDSAFGVVIPARGGFFRAGSPMVRYDALGAPQGSPWPVVQGYSPPSGLAISSNGSDFLAAWYNLSPAAGRPATQSFVRLSASGAVRDTTPIALPLTAGTRYGFGLVYDGDRADAFRFLNVGNQHERQTIDFTTRIGAPPVTMAGGPSGIVRGGSQRLLLGWCARRFDASWASLDPAERCYAAGFSNSPMPVAAFDGTNFTIVFRMERPHSSVYLARMSRDGVLLDTPARELSSLRSATILNLAYGGGTYLVVWKAGETLGTTLLAPDGSLGANVVLGTSIGNYPDVVFDGINFLVVWTGSGDGSLRAVRVSPAGVVLDPTPLTIVGDDAQPVHAAPPVMASNGLGTTAFVYTAFDPDLASGQVRAAFFHEDGGTIVDAGAPPDVPSDASAPRDVPSDASALLDVPGDAGALLDVPGDVGVVPVADAAAADSGTGGDPPPDDGAMCDVGGTPGRTTHRGFVVLVALGLALVRRRSGSRRRAA